MDAARGLLLGAVTWGLACAQKSLPGDQHLGTYALSATPVERSCELKEVSGAAFDFEVTLSRNADGSGAWFTLSGISRDAGWDGAVFSSTASAPRVFSTCGQCPTTLVETLSLALLSSSQAARVGFACPPNPLDGGVPMPDADAGITGPDTLDAGFDAVLACGELRTTLVADLDAGACPPECLACSTRFEVVGSPR